MTSTDENAGKIERCDWRRHAAAFRECGHVACRDCHPERFEPGAPCDYCDDMYDCADELMNQPIEIHC